MNIQHFYFICVAFPLVYNNSLFQLRFSGIDNCVDWVVSLLVNVI